MFDSNQLEILFFIFTHFCKIQIVPFIFHHRCTFVYLHGDTISLFKDFIQSQGFSCFLLTHKLLSADPLMFCFFFTLTGELMLIQQLPGTCQVTAHGLYTCFLFMDSSAAPGHQRPPHVLHSSGCLGQKHKISLLDG